MLSTVKTRYLTGLFVAVTVSWFACKGTPTAFQDGQARIQLNVLYPNQRPVSKSAFKSSAAAVDEVTVSVIGFNDLQEQTFFYIEDQPLTIDQSNNVASGIVAFSIGRGDEIIQNIAGVDVTGELVGIQVDMFEAGQLAFTGFTFDFFVAPNLLVQSPPIIMQSPITNGIGEVVGTIEVSPNPAVIFSTVDLFVDIAPGFIDQVADVFASFETPQGTQLLQSFLDLGGDEYESSVTLGNLGVLNFDFIAVDTNAVEVGSGTSFLHSIVDLQTTGFATNIDIQGDFDIAVGLASDPDFFIDIAWPIGDPQILASVLRFEEVGGVILWEIVSVPNPFGPNVTYATPPQAAQQTIPPNNQFPENPGEGQRYRITIEGTRGGTPVSSQMEFTFETGVSGPAR